MDEPSEESDDDELAVLMAEGNEDAFKLMLARHGPAVLGWLHAKYRLALDPHDLQTAFDDVALKVWQQAGTFDSKKGSLGAWLLYLLRLKILDVLKARTRHRSRFEQPLEDFNPVDSCSSADESELSGQRRREIQFLNRAIDTKLKGKQQKIIRCDLAAEGQADNAWIAEEIGSTPESVKVSRIKAVQNLRKHLKESQSLEERYRGKK